MTKQDYGTPMAFVRAVERRFSCAVEWDLAAHSANAKCALYLGAERDALNVAWTETLSGGVGWLNPPFANIERWARKCHDESIRGARIVMLTPASIGTIWYAAHVDGRALVVPITGRITFEPTTDPYPKDLMLTLWGWGCAGLCRPWMPQREALGGKQKEKT